jgi:histone H2A
MPQIYPMKAGVPQVSILGPLLYTLYTTDIPLHPSTVLSTFADETCILSPHPGPNQASAFLQSHLNELQDWFRKWRIKANERVFTSVPPWERLNVLQSSLTKLLSPLWVLFATKGSIWTKKLTWNPHTRLKQTETNRRYKMLIRLTTWHPLTTHSTTRF